MSSKFWVPFTVLDKTSTQQGPDSAPTGRGAVGSSSLLTLDCGVTENLLNPDTSNRLRAFVDVVVHLCPGLGRTRPAFLSFSELQFKFLFSSTEMILP